MRFQIKDENSGLTFADIENRFGLVPRVRWTGKPSWAIKFDTRSDADKMVKELSALPFAFQKSKVTAITKMPKLVVVEIA